MASAVLKMTSPGMSLSRESPNFLIPRGIYHDSVGFLFLQKYVLGFPDIAGCASRYCCREGHLNSRKNYLNISSSHERDCFWRGRGFLFLAVIDEKVCLVCALRGAKTFSALSEPAAGAGECAAKTKSRGNRDSQKQSPSI